jgi:hypothetical protein
VGEEHFFHYGKRCQNGEHCELCNYLNISDGVKTLEAAYDESTFYRGVNWFALTVAARTDPAQAYAVGRTLRPEDWEHENAESLVFGESHCGRVFVYPDALGLDQGYDWDIESGIRRFLGAVQCTFGKLVKNGWLDGIRAKVENSVQFLPYASHQHWHAVGSSKFFHDAQQMAQFIRNEVDSVLAETCPELYADVMVAVIPSPEDLTRWLKYMNKTVNLVQAVESVYSRYLNLSRGDELFQEFYEELRRYLERTQRVFAMVRLLIQGENGAHTYKLNRRYVRGSHKFGVGSILSEPERHRLWRQHHAKTEGGRRAKQRRAHKHSGRKAGGAETPAQQEQPQKPPMDRRGKGRQAAPKHPRRAREQASLPNNPGAPKEGSHGIQHESVDSHSGQVTPRPLIDPTANRSPKPDVKPSAPAPPQWDGAKFEQALRAQLEHRTPRPSDQHPCSAETVRNHAPSSMSENTHKPPKHPRSALIHLRDLQPGPTWEEIEQQAQTAVDLELHRRGLLRFCLHGKVSVRHWPPWWQVTEADDDFGLVDHFGDVF